VHGPYIHKVLRLTDEALQAIPPAMLQRIYDHICIWSTTRLSVPAFLYHFYKEWVKGPTASNWRREQCPYGRRD